MSYHTIIATSSFGLESIVAGELKSLGYENLTVENGRVLFTGSDRDIARCNIWLRSADRVLLRLAEFKARDFEELFQGALAVPWEEIIPENGMMHVTGKSIKSTLSSVPACQSVVKKAVVNAMKRRYKRSMFPEDGPVYKIEIAFLKDIATLTIDTSGAGLHKRGYRLTGGEAPLRETLAAAVIRLSKWKPDRVLADPFCGSGTIAIEAAMIGKNIAPGIKRTFAAESWPHIPAKIWKTLRDEAQAQINNTPLEIFASDSDSRVFRSARENAANAGVSDNIVFQKKPLSEFSSKKKFGCVICNPPWGERSGDRESAEALYREMNEVFTKLDSWSFFILSGHEGFEKHYATKATKNRKLYNGKIKCYLYEYFGPFPPRVKENAGGDDI